NPNITASLGIKTRYKTDREGRFRVVGLPGRGVVTAHTDDRSYRVGMGAETIEGRTKLDQLLTYDHIFTTLYQGIREVNLPEGETLFSCDLVLDPGRRMKVRLVDPAGAPLTGEIVATGRFPDLVDAGDNSLHGESVAWVSGLEPGKPRTVVFG